MRSSSQTTDIYGAVMAALRAVAPADEIEYNTLRQALRRLMEELPPKEQVTNTLRHTAGEDATPTTVAR
jgi:DNA-directed RNA polymerase sigma subunit (sigma70/sigma32)